MSKSQEKRHAALKKQPLPNGKCCMERITTLEKQLDTAESALDDYTDKALKLEAALLSHHATTDAYKWGRQCDHPECRTLTEVSDTEETPCPECRSEPHKLSCGSRHD